MFIVLMFVLVWKMYLNGFIFWENLVRKIQKSWLHISGAYLDYDWDDKV